MDGFLNWFFAFMTTMLGGVWKIFSNIFLGIVQIFNFPYYVRQLRLFSGTYTALDWVLTILAFILTFAIWGILLFMLGLVVRKYIRFRRTLVGNEDLLEEIADLHRDVIRLTQEKERIMALKIGQTNISAEQLSEILGQREESGGFEVPAHQAVPAPGEGEAKVETGGKRFFRLSAVDEKYEYYVAPEYNRSMSLSEICEDLRNYACSRARLFYDLKIIRLMFAGMASTKLILLQGISGTGKTSLPYIMGKYFQNDVTIASVQPSWRDRTELFGYFNEFTKRFNETEVLRRIYEASYNDDINIIVLDEMNIARVEYYFAEMLSVLEMPDPAEWKIELVPSSWESDPKHLANGKLIIPQNVWYVGTANNDDSTFAISDKVYDRALVINLDSKGMPFEAPETDPKLISYSYITSLFDMAVAEHPISKYYLEAIEKLDLYVIEKFRVAFGNRIMKQLGIFVPVYVACGGTELEAIDYLLATKVLRKFESLNLSLIRDEFKGLMAFMDSLFGKGAMKECFDYLGRLHKMY
ncbi:MAG: hypothetical protein GX057_07615 [Clostridiales bacterium]|nr:hypothetical protein [Clostridiales bacterium]HOA84401.1 hypothetical protein [Bacillota bacterium]